MPTTCLKEFNKIYYTVGRLDFKYITLVVCLSTNGERALNHTIVKRLILTTNTQATKIKSSFKNYVYTERGFNAIVTAPRYCLN